MEFPDEIAPCRQMGLIGECGAHRPRPQHDPPIRFAVALADVFIDHMDTAARASHRPEHVKTLFIDANARHVFASAILAMPEMLAIRRLIKALGDSCWEDAPLLDKAWDDLPVAVDEWAEI